jgi:type VI secretion system FHA domain protein
MPRPQLPAEGGPAQSVPLAPTQPQPERDSRPNPAPPTPAGLDLTALLRAAGVSQGDLSSEVAQELGKVLRVVVHGVMQVLQARAEIKSQFGLPVTRVQALENNPLKLSPNVESALHTLLIQRNPGYLPTVQAFEDAFADIRNHQLAMLEGVRVAFENMLGGFDPQELQREFDRSVKSRGLLGGMGAGARYWDLYTEHFARFRKDAEDTFRRLFGDAFAAAYEKQLEHLKKEEK